MANIASLLRSAATTFITAFIALVPLSAIANNDFGWAKSAAISAALTAIRTIVAYLDPGNTSYGIGAVETDASTEGDESA
jgi:hypothetical protein